MRAITVYVSDPVYREFQANAKKQDRKTSELIREAMEYYRDQKLVFQHNATDLKPSSVGKVLREFTRTDDLLDEMTNDRY